MTFRELHMTDVREVLRRWQSGHSARKIHQDQIANRKTASRYIAAAKAIGLGVADALTDEAVRAVADHVQERPALPPSRQWRLLAERRATIASWLHAKRPLTLVRVHELLARDGIEVSYTTLRRYARIELGWREPRSTVLVADPPAGEEAQVDFGLMGEVNDAQTKRRVWVLIVTLTYSRYMFVWPTYGQTVVDVVAGLDAAWAFFAGVVQRILPDNASSMVVRAHATSPTLHRGFAEYAQARGLFVDPARVARPKDKGRVENQVPYVRERWFAGERFGDLAAMRTHAAEWCRTVAGGRVHGSTRLVPRDVFVAEEQPRLQPPPSAPFDVPRWVEAKVHPDHHVQVERALYSVPTALLHKTVDVRVDRGSVRVYFGNELVTTHPRMVPGKRSTDPSHYPADKADYAMRSVDRVQAKAIAAGTHVGEFVRRLVAGPLPWTRMRQAYGVLRLCERYGNERVDTVCARAIAFEVFDVARIERMLKSARQLEEQAEQRGVLVPLPGRFARDASTFATRAAGKDGAAS